jgi:diguanylate cyclase (GGDEF)-like protein
MTILDRLGRVLGIAQSGPRLRILYACVIPTAVILAVTGIAVHRTLLGPVTDTVRLVGALGAVALAQLARVRVRLGRTEVGVAWGEAALIIAIYLIPLGWVPAAVLVGSLLAQVTLRVAGERRTPVAMAFNAANQSVAAAVATGVAVLVYPAVHDAQDLHIAAALLAAAVTYFLVNLLLIAAVVSFHTGGPFLELLRRAPSGKGFMVVGNIAVGLLVVVTISEDPRWLVVLPPVLWLLRQAYANRLRADDERRAWQVFSRATEALNRLEERGVAEAGVHGAARLFPAATAEVRVPHPDGVTWSYRGGSEAAVQNGPAIDGPTLNGSASSGPARAAVVSRTLQVGAAAVGELRLHFPSPVELTARERMQLSAFADALAAALHDAAAHRELQALSERSSHAAVHDPLTGVANREALLTKGNAALQAVEDDTAVALLLLDIDHFKEVNDTLGHAAGDELLRVTAARIGAYARQGELVARLSGDEFGLLITTLDSPVRADDSDARLALARRRARELAELVAMPTEVAGVQLAVEASVGVAVATAADADMTELVRRADIAMYRAKRGPCSVGWYDGTGEESSPDRLALLAELREALAAQDQFQLALQPVVDLHSGAPYAVEALVRWAHPRRGELVPKTFMKVLENSDLVGRFTQLMIDKALAVAAGWDPSVRIAVNLSPRSLLDDELPAQVAELLARHSVPAGRLVLEITETLVVPEHDAVNRVLDELKGIGVQLSVDDFGTGYSSLKFLTRVHVDEVKVDRSFVRRMVESPEAMAIVRTTVELARQLGLRVVAEGVETAEQRRVLAELGCTAAQGFHFFAPMPADRINGVLTGLARNSGGQVLPLRAADGRGTDGRATSGSATNGSAS